MYDSYVTTPNPLQPRFEPKHRTAVDEDETLKHQSHHSIRQLSFNSYIPDSGIRIGQFCWNWSRSFGGGWMKGLRGDLKRVEARTGVSRGHRQNNKNSPATRTNWQHLTLQIFQEITSNISGIRTAKSCLITGSYVHTNQVLYLL